jgi:hypothetical protein
MSCGREDEEAQGEAYEINGVTKGLFLEGKSVGLGGGGPGCGHECGIQEGKEDTSRQGHGHSQQKATRSRCDDVEGGSREASHSKTNVALNFKNEF